MKVGFDKDYRKLFTLEDIEHTKNVQKDLAEDTMKPAEYLKMAANEFLKNKRSDYAVEVLSAKAVFAKNGRVFDAYNDAGHMDVWIEGVVETGMGFLKCGAYLTDIWQIGGTDDAVEYGFYKYYCEA